MLRENKVKYQELTTKTNDELKKILVNNKKELFNLRVRKGLSETINPARIQVLRRDIARVLTALSTRSRIDSQNLKKGEK